MSTLTLGVKCKTCQDRYAETARDKNDPYGDDDAEFGVVLEWLTKEKAKKVIENTTCPKCGSENWYFTDSTDR